MMIPVIIAWNRDESMNMLDSIIISHVSLPSECFLREVKPHFMSIIVNI